MAFYLHSVMIVAIVAAAGNCSPLSDEQKAVLKGKLEANVAECGPQYGINFDQLIQWKKENKGPDDANKCFYACMFKKSGLLDNQGLFSESTALEKIKQYVSESKLEDATKAVTTCASVNEEDVSDGDAGCDRALLLYKCIHEQKDLLGINV